MVQPRASASVRAPPQPYNLPRLHFYLVCLLFEQSIQPKYPKLLSNFTCAYVIQLQHELLELGYNIYVRPKCSCQVCA